MEFGRLNHFHLLPVVPSVKIGMMQITIEGKPLEQVPADALIVPVFEGRKEERFGAAELWDSGEVSGKMLELTLLHHPTGIAASRVLLAGSGKPGEFGAPGWRKLVGAAVRHLKAKSVKRVAIVLDPEYSGPEYASAAVEGAILANFEPDRYRTGNDKKSIAAAAIVPPAGADLGRAVEHGRIMAEAQNFARTLVNEPANRLTPTAMADAARRMASEFHLECEVLDRVQMEQLGMGALLGVAQGSAEPPVLIVIKYRPPQVPSGGPHLGLVGKGVTFDTGGISIKPADGMEKMKYDMAGGAAMIGAMQAIAQIGPAIPVTAFIPCVENMPGSRAQRPGDIVTALSGKTIEVINTDAEGRLILADALVYARRQGCTHLVDAATLTGAIVVALGHLNVGLFANNDAMRDRVLAASKLEGERMWTMPLEPDYRDYLKSAFADVANVGGRWGGAVTAAMFLKEFAEETPWVHLDIAGTAWLDDEKPHLAKGPSGVPVRTLIRLAVDWDSSR
jgi:leucyl aminopeptidase